MLGSPGQNLKYLLENRRSMWEMGTTAGTSKGQNMHKRIFNLVQALPRTSLLWGMLQSPPKHPNAQPALARAASTGAPNEFKRQNLWSLWCPGTPGWCPDKSCACSERCWGTELGDVCLHAAQHWEAGWEHFTFLERKVCWYFLEVICTECTISEWWLHLVNINWLGCRKFSSCHYSLLFPSLHMSSRTHKK